MHGNIMHWRIQVGAKGQLHFLFVNTILRTLVNINVSQVYAKRRKKASIHTYMYILK